MSKIILKANKIRSTKSTHKCVGSHRRHTLTGALKHSHTFPPTRVPSHQVCHMVLLYCMPVLEAMLDQGSRLRSRDWAWRYSLWGIEQGLRLARAEPMCWM